MKKILSFLCALLLVQAYAFSQDEKSEKTRVLFVGNSFTFFWNMPQMVNAMARLEDFPMEVRQSTVSGSTWKQHFKEEKDTQTRKLLTSEKWDYVILQDHSLSTVEAPDRFKKYGGRLVREVEKNGAVPYFMTTWAYLSNPLLQETISNSYKNLATSSGTKAIPVGEVFMKARRLRPDLNLYFDDKHPSADGSYLIALIMYRALTGNSVKNIPDRLTATDSDGEKIILSFVHHEDGLFFRQLIDETIFEPHKLIQK